jgi:hypothetical protein
MHFQFTIPAHEIRLSQTASEREAMPFPEIAMSWYRSSLDVYIDEFRLSREDRKNNLEQREIEGSLNLMPIATKGLKIPSWFASLTNPPSKDARPGELFSWISLSRDLDGIKVYYDK